MAACKAIVYGTTHCRSPVVRDGWCGTHHPEAVAKREAAVAARAKVRDAVIAERRAEIDARKRKAEIFDDLLATLKECCAFIAEEPHNDHGYRGHLLRIADRVIAQAEDA